MHTLTPDDRIALEYHLARSGVCQGRLPAYAVRVLWLRRLLALSQPQFARLLSACPATVSRWEHGHKRPSHAMAQRLSSIVGDALPLYRSTLTPSPEYFLELVTKKEPPLC